MDDFQQIKLALQEINQAHLTQSMEIAELRRQVQGLVQASTQPKSVGSGCRVSLTHVV